MADYRLKIKIGEHEFEADGPVDAVKSQFEAFKELITSLTAQKQTNPSATRIPVRTLSYFSIRVEPSVGQDFSSQWSRNFPYCAAEL